ncbi:hypothetical protein BGP_6603 [Beggiatoa sp. PS]|nr:hypothetical protein BGP_6603 [Beggiatoa sp. PS]
MGYVEENGSHVCSSKDEAKNVVHQIMNEKIHGEAGNKNCH